MPIMKSNNYATCAKQQLCGLGSLVPAMLDAWNDCASIAIATVPPVAPAKPTALELATGGCGVGRAELEARPLPAGARRHPPISHLCLLLPDAASFMRGR